MIIHDVESDTKARPETPLVACTPDQSFCLLLVPLSELDAGLCLSVHLPPHAGGGPRGQRALCVSFFNPPGSIPVSRSARCLPSSVNLFRVLSSLKYSSIHVFFVFSTCAGVLTLFTSACYLWSAQRHRAPLHLSDKQQFYAQVFVCLSFCVCVDVFFMKCVPPLVWRERTVIPSGVSV